MGCCVSSDASAQALYDVESSKRCTLPEYNNWIQLLAEDLGKDRLAIPRDYPRMKVEVLLNDAPLDCLSPKSGAYTDSRRYDVLRATTVQIATVCGEGDSVGSRVSEAWDELRRTQPALFQQPDANPVAHRVLEAAGILRPVDTETSTAGEGQSSITYNVLLTLTQGVVFFPVQRLLYLLWFPWMTRVMDVSWMCTVARNVNSFPEHVYVTHRQVFTNYVAPGDEEGSIPKLFVTTELVLTIDSKSGGFVAAALNVVEATIGKGKWGVCSSGNNKSLWKLRRAALVNRLRDVFEVEAKCSN